MCFGLKPVQSPLLVRALGFQRRDSPEIHNILILKALTVLSGIQTVKNRSHSITALMQQDLYLLPCGTAERESYAMDTCLQLGKGNNAQRSAQQDYDLDWYFSSTKILFRTPVRVLNPWVRITDCPIASFCLSDGKLESSHISVVRRLDSMLVVPWPRSIIGLNYFGIHTGIRNLVPSSDECLPPATRPGCSGRIPASPISFGSSTPAHDPPAHLARCLRLYPPPPPPCHVTPLCRPQSSTFLLLSALYPHLWSTRGSNRCEDTFEVFTTMKPTTDIKVLAQITMVGLKMVALEAAQWWSKNRAAMKALTTDAEFITKIRERFTPSASQISLPLPQTAQGVLGTAGPTWKITDTMFKNHLLFHYHCLLLLRVCAIPNLGYNLLKVESLINTMSSTWNSMLAEGIVRQELLLPVIGNLSRSGANGLSEAEHADLRAAGGCFHCRKTPLSPGWKAHSSKTCPDDPTCNIPPTPTPVIAAAVGASPVDSDVDSEHEYADAEYDTNEFRELVMREDEESD
ncbi:hypothetical protein BKA70DRAFT_1235593 [Coprinopsis sp. MPI-PUGE-AT-0042]|nr:hypothetical protein BKA70DRAFT_1235593 [Coprinopsis sp. MPI-PUGE-AT-0042]